MKVKILVASVLCVVGLSGCATGGYGGYGGYGYNDYGLGGYGKTVTGAALGGAAGGLIGSAMGGSGSTAAGVLLGTAAGAYMGNQLDQTDQRRRSNDVLYRHLENGQPRYGNSYGSNNCYQSYDRNNRPVTICPN